MTENKNTTAGYRVLPAVKTSIIMFVPWFFAPMGAVSPIYPAIILTYVAIVYTVTIKDEPNSVLYRLSALAATAFGVILGLFGSNIIGKKVFLGEIFSGLYCLTAAAMLVILLMNDAASVIFLIRKRRGKAGEKRAFTQRFPAVSAVICAACAFAAAVFPIVLVLLQNAIGFPLSRDDRDYPLMLTGYLVPAFTAALYFRLLPKDHKRYIPVCFFAAGIAGTVLTLVIFQNVFLQDGAGSFRYYMNNREYPLTAGLTVFTVVPIADFVLLRRNKEQKAQAAAVENRPQSQV